MRETTTEGRFAEIFLRRTLAPPLACSRFNLWAQEGIQSSSGIITVMAGCGSSMSSGPQVAINLIRRERWLSLRTYSATGMRSQPGRAAEDSEAEHPDNIPKASGFILAGHVFRHGDVGSKTARVRNTGNLIPASCAVLVTSTCTPSATACARV